MRISRRISMIIAVVCLGLLATACDGDTTSASGSDSRATSAVRPTSTATLTIVTPKIGSVVKGSTVNVKVELDGATIVTATSTDLQPDEGHLHVILDDQLVSMTATTETEISDVAAGHHILKVAFVANDHGPFFPNVVAVTSFEVKA